MIKNLSKIGLIFILLFISIFVSSSSLAHELNSVSHYTFPNQHDSSITSPLSESDIEDLFRNKDFNIVGFRNAIISPREAQGKNKYIASSMVYIVQPGDSLYLIAQKNNISIAEIKELNNLDSDMILVGQALLLEEKSSGNIVYIVEPGDSLYQIAIRNNTTIQKIKDLNDLKSDIIYIGQDLLIPSGDNEQAEPDDSKNDNYKRYTVKAGDSLYLIAYRNDTTVEDIKNLNNLDSDMIFVDQKILVPVESKEKELPEQGELEEIRKDAAIAYFVHSGDSLYRIANIFNTSVDRIRQLNGLTSNSLYLGQLLYITAPVNNSNYLIYYVQSGDSLSLIAEYFSSSVEEIKHLNDLSSDYLNRDQDLLIRLADYSSKKHNMVFDYQVEGNDNIHTIAGKFDLSPWEIRYFNNLENDILNQGENLEIPLSVSNEEINFPKSISEKEMEYLRRTIFSESRGEPFIGQVAVAAVVLNRVRSPLFPDTIERVVFQSGQFEAVDDGQIWLTPRDPNLRQTVLDAINGWDPSGGALYYFNPDTATSAWIWSRPQIKKIGRHIFCR